MTEISVPPQDYSYVWSTEGNYSMPFFLRSLLESKQVITAEKKNVSVTEMKLF